MTAKLDALLRLAQHKCIYTKLIAWTAKPSRS